MGSEVIQDVDQGGLLNLLDLLDPLDPLDLLDLPSHLQVHVVLLKPGSDHENDLGADRCEADSGLER